MSARRHEIAVAALQPTDFIEPERGTLLAEDL